MSWWKWLISALSAWSLIYRERFSKKTQEKQDAKEKFNKAADEGNARDVLDSFNDVN